MDLTSVPNPIGSVFAVAPDFRPSYAQQFNLTLEHEIVPGSLSIRAAAVGNLGRHLYNTWNANQPIPGPAALNTRRPLFSQQPALTDVSYFASDGLSSYYAGQLTVDKRFGKGVSALVGYTWSHAIDNVVLEFGGGAAGPQPQDPRNLRAERGNSIIDLRHRLTASYLWELPFGKGRAFMNRGGLLNLILGGWQTNGILTVQTGQPFSPVLQTSTTNGTGSRPDVIGTVTYPKTLQRWFDPSAFATPAPYTYGNAGRNISIRAGSNQLGRVSFQELRHTRRDSIRVSGGSIQRPESSAVRSAESEHRQCAGGLDYEHRWQPTSAATRVALPVLMDSFSSGSRTVA